MASSASNRVNNLSGELHRIKCILGHDHKKCETYGIKYKYCNCFLEYTNFRDNLIECKCLRCNKNCLRLFDTYKFPNNDNNKFVLLLRKVVYSYDEYMRD